MIDKWRSFWTICKKNDFEKKTEKYREHYTFPLQKCIWRHVQNWRSVWCINPLFTNICANNDFFFIFVPSDLDLWLCDLKSTSPFTSARSNLPIKYELSTAFQYHNVNVFSIESCHCRWPWMTLKVISAVWNLCESNIIKCSILLLVHCH